MICCRPAEGDVEAGTVNGNTAGLTPQQYIQLTKLRTHFQVSSLEGWAAASSQCSDSRPYTTRTYYTTPFVTWGLLMINRHLYAYGMCVGGKAKAKTPESSPESTAKTGSTASNRPAQRRTTSWMTRRPWQRTAPAPKMPGRGCRVRRLCAFGAGGRQLSTASGSSASSRCSIRGQAQLV